MTANLVRIYKALGGGWQIRLNAHRADPIAHELLRLPVAPESGTTDVPEVLVAPESP